MESNNQQPKKTSDRVDETRKARAVSVRAIVDALMPTIMAVFAARNTDSREAPVEFRLEDTHYGAKATCFAPDHRDRNASLELHYRNGENWWTCRSCGIAPLPKDSSITLVQKVWETEDHWDRKAGRTVHERTFTKAKQFCLELLDAGAPASAIPTGSPEEISAARRDAHVAADDAARQVLEFILERNMALRAKNLEKTGSPISAGLARWYTLRGFPPGTDLFPDVVEFPGDKGYDRLRREFSNEVLDRAGFISLAGKDLYGLCGALFIFRDPNGIPRYCQGFRLPTPDDLIAALDARARRRSVAGRAENGAPRVTGFETPDELVVKVAEIQAWHRDAERQREADRKRPPKYLGASRGQTPWPFGMERAYAGGRCLVVCEGVPDALAAMVYGIGDAAVAVPGVGYRGSHWIRPALVDENGVPKWDQVIVAYDGDHAGEAASEAFLGLLEAEGVPHVGERQILAAALDGKVLEPVDGTITVVRYVPAVNDLNDAFGVC